MTNGSMILLRTALNQDSQKSMRAFSAKLPLTECKPCGIAIACPMSYQTEAARAHAEVEQHLKDGNPVHGYDWGEYYWHKFQYASVSPEFSITPSAVLRHRGESKLAKQLVQIVVLPPRIPAVHEAMHEAMIMVEGLLMVGEAIDFTATEPDEIVQWEHVGQYQ